MDELINYCCRVMSLEPGGRCHSEMSFKISCYEKNGLVEFLETSLLTRGRAAVNQRLVTDAS